ncbi:MAG: thioredoxin family protein [Holophagaceae bacterium]|uniref:Thioredoxin family protein n=1 Tax=Candidatus Geothrix skivensis TaxID=2954439 RepID=A0A9D7XGR3_9BACT|nr:thioredoxin family protein [Candidatus Geothrix skivensis]
MSFPRLGALVFTLSASLFAQGPVPALDPAGLSQILSSRKWTVIEFGGPTCVPCVRMQPILGELQQTFGSRAHIRNFYVTQYPKEAQLHRIMVMPTQVVFDPAGREVARHIGYWPKDEFLSALAKAGLK